MTYRVVVRLVGRLILDLRRHWSPGSRAAGVGTGPRGSRAAGSAPTHLVSEALLLMSLLGRIDPIWASDRRQQSDLVAYVEECVAIRSPPQHTVSETSHRVPSCPTKKPD